MRIPLKKYYLISIEEKIQKQRVMRRASVRGTAMSPRYKSLRDDMSLDLLEYLNAERLNLLRIFAFQALTLTSCRSDDSLSSEPLNDIDATRL